jgi:hypothetical protein
MITLNIKRQEQHSHRLTAEPINTSSRNLQENIMTKKLLIFLYQTLYQRTIPQSIWIGEIINSGERTYQEWMRRQQSLTYLFKEQSTELFSQTKLENVFDCSKGHPILLKAFLKSELAPEIMVIYDTIFSYISEFDKKLLDPVWETVSLKIKKYRTFSKY